MTTLTIINGNMCQVDGPLRVTSKLYEDFRIKHPNAWHIRMYQRGSNKWDGYVKYISDRGQFRIGLLGKVYEKLKEYGEKVKVVDLRMPLDVSPVIPNKLGELTLREDQKKALRTLLNNKVGGVPFLICAGDYAVGFGKSLLFSAIFKAYHRQLKTILLLNDSDLFKQFKKEIPAMLPEENVCFIQGGKVDKWGMFNVAMVQSLSRNLKKYATQLADMDIVLIDETDIIDSKTYKSVIERLYNSRIRIGLSGTLYMSDKKKDVIHNMNIMSFIGDKIDQVTLLQQMKRGNATPVVVKCIEAKYKPDNSTVYMDQYRGNIIDRKEAYEFSAERAVYNAKRGRLPMVIVTKFMDHCEWLYNYYRQHPELSKYNIAYMHHNTKKRSLLMEKMRRGELDILISTTIISRGKNIPDLRYLQNASDMDSNEKTIQVLGRLVRKSAKKNKAYLDDLLYPGKYLKRHGNHRKKFYRNQGLKVIFIRANK